MKPETETVAKCLAQLALYGMDWREDGRARRASHVARAYDCGVVDATAHIIARIISLDVKGGVPTSDIADILHAHKSKRALTKAFITYIGTFAA
jgi:hypothetical protein